MIGGERGGYGGLSSWQEEQAVLNTKTVMYLAALKRPQHLLACQYHGRL